MLLYTIDDDCVKISKILSTFLPIWKFIWIYLLFLINIALGEISEV